jgi:hypothetical protein
MDCDFVGLMGDFRLSSIKMKKNLYNRAYNGVSRK